MNFGKEREECSLNPEMRNVAESPKLSVLPLHLMFCQFYSSSSPIYLVLLLVLTLPL